MTNTTTTSNSVSSRSRAIPLNSAVAPHLAIMSSSSASPYPPLPATMTNPPPIVQYPTLTAGQASSTYLRSNINPVNAASTAHAIGSSTHSTYYNHPLASSSALPMNLSNSSTQLKSAPPKPKLPEYLANTSFAELYNKAHAEKFSGDNSEEKARLWHVINATPMPPVSSPLASAPISQAASEANLTANAHQLILSYLIHHGFSETAKAFSRDAVRISQTYNNEMNEMEGVESENPSVDMDMDMLNRQRNIDLAIELTDKCYSDVLQSNDDILFQLRCRKFIEMIGACAGTKITLSDNEDVSIKVDNSHTMSEEDDTDDEEVNESTEEDEDDDDEEDEDDEYKDAMDVDEFSAIISQSDCESDDEIDGPLTPHKKRRVPKRRKVTLGLDGLDDAMKAALKFGCELHDDYRDDDREEIKNALKDAFSLMAYDDPRISCVAHLLDPSGREPVANALNSAILVSQGKPKIPSLEQVYRQASVVLHELSRNGVGSSAFVNVRKDCLI
ncbi:7465_t:CDS:2 [Dentiscutata erythropus]|uniref:7465_t:CDS:1 n=1 Tax=Dentiscutata erythropus TaxID=1348616 RepID=A0A9N9EFQ8_9GLOM|nr:7465_t:CDS:2 [Dentiscutata erythropus]